MKWKTNIVLLALGIFSVACTEKITTEFFASNLRCEYMKEAIVSKSSPRFSWELASTESEQWQTAWQLIVSDQKTKLDDREPV